MTEDVLRPASLYMRQILTIMSLTLSRIRNVPSGLNPSGIRAYRHQQGLLNGAGTPSIMQMAFFSAMLRRSKSELLKERHRRTP